MSDLPDFSPIEPRTGPGVDGNFLLPYTAARDQNLALLQQLYALNATMPPGQQFDDGPLVRAIAALNAVINGLKP